MSYNLFLPLEIYSFYQEIVTSESYKARYLSTPTVFCFCLCLMLY